MIRFVRHLAAVSVLALAPTVGAAAGPYDPEVFTVEEINRLRQSTPLARLRVYDRVIQRQVRQVNAQVPRRNAQGMRRILERFDRAMGPVVEDCRVVVELPGVHRRSELKRLEITLRRATASLRGVRRALPVAMDPDFDPVVRRLEYARKLLFRKIHGLDERP